MSPQILKTIELIKKSYDQPILFHMLHSHLSHLLIKTTPAYEITDDWSKILIFSCHFNNTLNQAIELKIQQHLKRFRPPFDNEKKLKTMIICYYLLNRPSNLINHILVFELIFNFLGISNYFDGLILKIFSNMLISKVYDIEGNKKLKEDSIKKMQEVIKSKELCESNKIRALVCFIVGDIKPFNLDFIMITSSFLSFKTLEIICLYAKYTQNSGFIKEVLPNDEFFILSLEQFMKCEFDFEGDEKIQTEKCSLINSSFFDKIKFEYDRSNDKEKFVTEIIDFLKKLN